jgi:hypothetical protein
MSPYLICERKLATRWGQPTLPPSVRQTKRLVSVEAGEDWKPVTLFETRKSLAEMRLADLQRPDGRALLKLFREKAGFDLEKKEVIEESEAWTYLSRQGLADPTILAAVIDPRTASELDSVKSVCGFLTSLDV